MAPRKASEAGAAEIERLKRELAATREYLQSVIEEQERVIGELRERNTKLLALLPPAPEDEEKKR